MAVQISDKHKCIFVHIPKAAGSSIETSEIFEDQRAKTGEYVGGHTTALEYKEIHPDKFDYYYKFAFVRNPYSRLVSAFSYLSNNRPDKKIYEKHFGAFEENFDDFCERLYSDQTYNYIIHLKPQYEFVCDEDFNIIVDFVGKQEYFRSDAKKVFKKIGIKYRHRHILKSDHKHFSEYYTPEKVEIVREIYKKDFDLFNYKSKIEDINENIFYPKKYYSRVMFRLYAISRIIKKMLFK